ncbi:MAG: trypsin-like peptidase domain-containing protein [Flavobacteriaceae bacterium]
MYIEEANNLLHVNEEEYFKPTSSSSVHYIAVVKKSLNPDIIDDYVIEIGMSNYRTATRHKFLSDFDNDFINDSIKKGLENNDVIINLGVSEFKYQNCNGLKEKITGGVSVSYKDSTNVRGTAGAFFKMLNNSKEIYLLSNHHVLVDKDESNKIIVHPSRLDCKNPIEIGELYWKCFNQYFDAAIAKINYPVDIGKFTSSKHLIFNGIEEPKIGQNIRKYGLKTKLTHGEVRSVNCTISNGDNYPKYYRNQILTSFMSLDGDSGSVLVNSDNKVIGLIFGGDDETSTYANNITKIFKSNICGEPKISFSKFV